MRASGEDGDEKGSDGNKAGDESLCTIGRRYDKAIVKNY